MTPSGTTARPRRIGYLADAVGEEHPTNLPGISEGYPNWRRKLEAGLESLPALPLFRAVTAAMAKERPR